MTGVFISYRRNDSKAFAGRLYDHLLQRYDEGEVFMDVEDIEPGEDFATRIEQVLAQCDALIAVIGPQWLEICDERGRRRLDDPDDLVRREIASALRLGIRVFPVLVDRAQMPRAGRLPNDLAPLAERAAIELSDDRFAYDVDRLLKAIGGAYGRVIVSVQKSYLQLALRLAESIDVFICSEHLLRSRLGDTYRYRADSGRYRGLEQGTEVAKQRVLPGQGTTFRIKEGTHAIWATWKPIDRAERSLPLVFRLKGGQTIAFLVKTKETHLVVELQPEAVIEL
jgi:hypothetical protein